MGKKHISTRVLCALHPNIGRNREISEVLQKLSTYMKPATEGIGFPYETKSTKSRGQARSRESSTTETTLTLLTKSIQGKGGCAVVNQLWALLILNHKKFFR